MKVYWATRLRGFLRHVSERIITAQFVESSNYYEVNTLLGKVKSKLIHAKLFDYTGTFQVIDAQNQDCDMYGSFNRLLSADKPYFIYLENPTALYHYCLDRIRFRTGKKRFSDCLNNKNLRYIICMSDACKDTFEKINMQVPDHVTLTRVYPLVPNNKLVSEVQIHSKSRRETLECLFCVQGVRFVSKGGLETMRAVNALHQKGVPIHLTVITKISDVDKAVLDEINSYPFVTLHDFTFTYAELEEIYANTNVLIQATSDESFGLTILEAMKGGCALIGSRMYAIPEMVRDGYNGYLVDPHHWFFDQNNIPNPKVWNQRRKTIYSGKVSEKLINDITEKLTKLLDRDLLEKLSLNSYKLSMSDDFNEEQIVRKWDAILRDIATEE